MGDFGLGRSLLLARGVWKVVVALLGGGLVSGALWTCVLLPPSGL